MRSGTAREERLWRRVSRGIRIADVLSSAADQNACVESLPLPDLQALALHKICRQRMRADGYREWLT